MRKSKKSKEIRFRAAALDCKRLAALARHYELTPSEVMRRLLRDEASRVELVTRVTPLPVNGARP